MKTTTEVQDVQVTAKVQKPKISPLAIKAIEMAQANNPKKDLSELVMEASAIYEELRAQGRTTTGDAFTRATAIATILKENPKLGKKEVIVKADKMYSERTGREGNEKETAFVYSHVWHALNVFNVL